MKNWSVTLLSLAILGLVGCAKQEPYDYSAYQQSDPKSILLVMPDNMSTEVKADIAVLSKATVPLAEKGYYVFPVALVDEVFKNNGLTNGHDIQATNIKKIYDVFGADAVMYINIDEYGTSYKVFDSVTTVSLQGKLVDLRSGKLLWDGKGVAQSNSTSSNDGLLVAVIKAAVNQVRDTLNEKGYQLAGQATGQLFATGYNGGLLYGSKHPLYKKDPQLNAK